jgi:hypothetical protein
MVYLAVNGNIQRGKQNRVFKTLPCSDSDIEEDNELKPVTDEWGTSSTPTCERGILLSSGMGHDTVDVQRVKNPTSGYSS